MVWHGWNQELFVIRTTDYPLTGIIFMGSVAHCPRVGSRVSVWELCCFYSQALKLRGSNTPTRAVDYKKDINKQPQTPPLSLLLWLQQSSINMYWREMRSLKNSSNWAADLSSWGVARNAGKMDRVNWGQSLGSLDRSHLVHTLQNTSFKCYKSAECICNMHIQCAFLPILCVLMAISKNCSNNTWAWHLNIPVVLCRFCCWFL